MRKFCAATAPLSERPLLARAPFAAGKQAMTGRILLVVIVAALIATALWAGVGDLLTLESAVTAIEEAASAVAREVERDRLRETSLARLSTVEAELNRSRLALEKIIQEETA